MLPLYLTVFSRQFLQKLSDKSLEGSRASVLVALSRRRNGASGSVLITRGSLVWGCSGIIRQSLEEEFCELRHYGVLGSSGARLCVASLTHPKRLNHRPHTPNEHEDPQDKR
jgi:hypothetical protein